MNRQDRPTAVRESEQPRKKFVAPKLERHEKIIEITGTSFPP